MSIPEQHRSYGPKAIRFASLTVSDSRTEETDGGGATIRRLVEEAGFDYRGGRIVPDEPAAVLAAFWDLVASSEADVVVTTGGTGFSPRDVTRSTLEPLWQTAIEGFGELFRMLSHRQIGAAAMLSRAAAGVVEGLPVFVLPGSPKAVELALSEIILPEIGHLLGQLRRGERHSEPSGRLR